MNTIGVIAPYRYEGMWVFDDPRVGLNREPFVAGIDSMIDRLVASIPGAEKGFRLLFSATQFPGYTVNLEWSGRKKQDRKSTRLNSSHRTISYAVFCLKKKKIERK